MKFFRLCFLLWLLPVVSIFSQGIHGRLTDAANNPVPYVAIYDETTYAGTTSNADGYFDLKLAPGKHSLVFKAMGYYLERRQVTTAESMVMLNIQLKEQPLEIKEVVITPGKEDPAYAMMRKVIARAPYHLNQVKEYMADVYLRGTIHIIKIPKIIAKNTEIDGKKNVLKNGDVFIQESVNQLHFMVPDHYEQKVISYHSTFPGDGNEVNPMEIIRSSFYQPKIDEILSPLAPNAFSIYNYRYEGFFEEGKNIVFKIRVTPKRNSQQLMKGYLYIVDKLWCLHTVDVTVEMFFGTMGYKTIFSPIKSNAWLPISYQFNVDAAIVGIKANYKYSGSVKFSQVVLNEKVPASKGKSDPVTPAPQAAQTKTEAKKQQRQAEMEKLLTKEELTNRDMVKLATLMATESAGDTSGTRSLEIKDPVEKITIEKDALKMDTAYWNEMRPIPLTHVEALIPGIQDSLSLQQNTLAVKDSAGNKKAPRKISKVLNFVTSGSGFWAFDSTLRFQYEGLIGIKKFDFNTVDGFIYRQSFRLEQKIDSTHRLIASPGIAYAFSRQKIMGWLDMNYDYAPMRNGNLHFHISSRTADYNAETGINSSINSLATLFFRRNYMKLYERNQVFLTNKIDLANGLRLNATIGYQTALPLDNSSDYSFFYRDTRQYTSNTPNDDPAYMLRNIYNEEAYWDFQIEYTPRYYYRMRGGRKHYQYSEYPTFYIRNRMAIPGIFNSSADYDLLEAGIKQRKTWGLMHAFSWHVKAGTFLNGNKVFLMNDKYFNNQYLPVSIGNIGEPFRLIPFYQNATTQSYAEAHVQFTTPYLLIKYLPFLSNKLWVENLHLNYLITDQHLYYWEVGYSVSQIFMVANVGIYTGFKGTDYQSVGIQVGINFE